MPSYVTPGAPVKIQTTATTLFTVPAGKIAQLKELGFSNDSSSARQLYVYRHTAAGADFSIRPNSSTTAIPAKDVELWHLDTFLDEGESVRATASANNDIHAWSVSYILTDKV